MGRLTVRLPDALHRQLENLAKSEGVSLNHYLVYALTRQATLDAQAKAGGTAGGGGARGSAERQRTGKSGQRPQPAAVGKQEAVDDLLDQPGADVSPDPDP